MNDIKSSDQTQNVPVLDKYLIETTQSNPLR